MSLIDIALVAWPNHPRRIQYLRATLNALFESPGLTASRHRLRWFCSSETERDPRHSWHGDELEELCRQHSITLRYREGRAGLGENMNAAIRLCSAELVFVVQDDWLLLHPLDLSGGADLMAANPGIDMIRYSWPGNDRVTLIPQADGWPRFKLDGGWPYGDDPHLQRGDFTKKFGAYMEGEIPHGTSEGGMVHSMIARGANIRAADRIYFGHGGPTPSVIREQRECMYPR